MNALSPKPRSDGPAEPPLPAPTRPTVVCADMREALRRFPENTFHSVVTDPPYHLTSIVERFGKPGSAPARHGAFARASRGFMGASWDGGDVAFRPETWAEVHRVMRPGACLAAFGGSRTFHRVACAVEDAGFEIRDTLLWLYSTGMPKSHDLGKALDRAGEAGLARQWDGWGTALKPSAEMIVLARKPLDGTNAENAVAWGVGGLNIKACRVPGEAARPLRIPDRRLPTNAYSAGLGGSAAGTTDEGRWPANTLTDGSPEVRDAFPQAPGQIARSRADGTPKMNAVYGPMRHGTTPRAPRVEGETSAARFFASCPYDDGEGERFFYSGKAGRADRDGSAHPTVKPISLMAWLCRLVTPPGGLVLDPFAGSGTTGAAALREGFVPVLVEREEGYARDCVRRLKSC